ncbi:hypothetical protein L3Q82_026842 [Scortum barcoo]|uniref:Uncharacterized protein n=1 Tax=Scortum barcoo TaxID=214431 RepID=A0ACB8WJN1_9TELE|nr:hypothetical protein L3Q82_026842 [Scortum barcoo]
MIPSTSTAWLLNDVSPVSSSWGSTSQRTFPWTANTSSLIKKAHQRLFFLRTLKKNHLSTAITLGNFYRERESLGAPAGTRQTLEQFTQKMDSTFRAAVGGAAGLRLGLSECVLSAPAAFLLL